MKYNNILHITDDCLYLKSKKQKDIIKYKLSKNIVYGGRISNIKKFMKSFEMTQKMMKKMQDGKSLKKMMKGINPEDLKRFK